MSTNSTYSKHLKKLVVGALFVALAYVVRLVIPPIDVMFLSFEFKDAVLAMGAMYLGPVWALVMSALVALLEFATLSSTGVYGMIMNFAAASAFTVTASLIYRFHRSMAGAAIAVSSAIVTLVAVMLPLNLWITPYFMGAPRSMVVELIPTLLLPFNAAKGIMNAGITLLLYKPVMTAMRQTGLVERRATPAPTSDDGTSQETPRRSNYLWLSVLLAAIFITVGLVVFFVFLNGKFGHIEY